MEVPAGFLVASLLLSCFAATGCCATFSSLQRTLVVTASPTQGQGLIITLDYNLTEPMTSATYFVRAYAFDAQDKEIAFGQSTDVQKSTNLFEVQAITGRHVSLDIASVCFSAFSIVSLAGFFYMEKRKAKLIQQIKSQISKLASNFCC